MLDRFGGKLEDHSLAAAQESDRRVMQAIADKRSFAVETVLSSNKFIKMIQAAKAAGFLVVTIFVYLRDPKTNISRIENRVAQGGHPVPGEKVRSRHPKSLKNLEWASSMSDFTYVFENDRDGYGIIAATRFHDGWAANEAAAYEGFKSCVRPLWTQLGFARLP